MSARTFADLRAWADTTYRHAERAARTRISFGETMVCGEDMADWRNHMSRDARLVIDGLMADGLWSPPE